MKGNVVSIFFGFRDRHVIINDFWAKTQVREKYEREKVIISYQDAIMIL